MCSANERLLVWFEVFLTSNHVSGVDFLIIQAIDRHDGYQEKYSKATNKPITTWGKRLTA